LAAHRYGIKRVILPERNLKDLVEVPAAVLGSLEVMFLFEAYCLSALSVHVEQRFTGLLWNCSVLSCPLLGSFTPHFPGHVKRNLDGRYILLLKMMAWHL
jgi:hypothetical protein